ncbi:TraX family protein [Mycoplasmopsis alligatoris]|uniref:Protein TraX n=1 Tax=Mycoplasmopsis alligatoris A21JP2 TaxID=747682 RepID=D4XV27_9BACT|nr:TraX family protein [Mycoplasmopsis alligatoris]EFF41830.1 conserved hypothetical protein [Mycoplasmopsis alligatoris A21JP2]
MNKLVTVDKITSFLSGNILKIIAIIAMFIDHFGAITFNQPDFLWMRIVGRITMPIFAFLCIIGFEKTRRPILYFVQLLIIGLVLHLILVIHLYIVHKRFVNDMLYFNIFIMFGLVSLVWYCLKQIKIPIIFFIGVVIFILFSVLLTLSTLRKLGGFRIDYGIYLWLILHLSYLVYSSVKKYQLKIMFYKLSYAFIFTALTLLFYLLDKNWVQNYALIALIPILFYSEKIFKKSSVFKYTFLACYPLSILIPTIFTFIL